MLWVRWGELSWSDGLAGRRAWTVVSWQGSVRKMDMVLVQGKMIRYVHIPDEVDAMQNLQKHVGVHPMAAHAAARITPSAGRPLSMDRRAVWFLLCLCACVESPILLNSGQHLWVHRKISRNRTVTSLCRCSCFHAFRLTCLMYSLAHMLKVRVLGTGVRFHPKDSASPANSRKCCPPCCLLPV